jgi:hypothetical protein
MRNLIQHRWVIGFVLLCFLMVHSVTAIHKHVSPAEFDACFICQLVDHQPVNVPQSLPTLLFLFQMLFWTVGLQCGGVIPALPSFERPRSRAPPPAIAQ